MRTPLLWAGVVAAVLLAPLSRAQTTPLSPRELVRQSVEAELDPAGNQTRFMFRVHKQTPSGSQTKIFVQTREAVAGLVVANNDKPLSPEQQKGEIWRIRRFLKDPAEMKKKQKQEKEDAERYERIIRALPDAFVYEYDGTENGQAGVGQAGLVLTRLKFHPNPQYDPPSRVEQVLTGMAGHMLLDAKKLRIARIQGTLAEEVSFGWGFLGHLDRGGRILIEQGNVWEGQWRVTRLEMAFTGKILLFKSINVQSAEISSDFHPVSPDLSYAQGVELLRQQQVTIAGQSGRAGRQ
ncbi:MAG TPA: hypothetical protein VGF06_05165 [Terriglobales bacterium]